MVWGGGDETRGRHRGGRVFQHQKRGSIVPLGAMLLGVVQNGWPHGWTNSFTGWQFIFYLNYIPKIQIRFCEVEVSRTVCRSHSSSAEGNISSGGQEAHRCLAMGSALNWMDTNKNRRGGSIGFERKDSVPETWALSNPFWGSKLSWDVWG